ncbi:MAG: 50S ribosomal protein L2 [Candidatus Pacebacteria bacterium]|nr:50S ribosomal protein L2 [Candidatus Paceibacterota bacterium]
MKTFKPRTPGQRGRTQIAYGEILTVQKPLKSLTSGRKRGVGRNNQGRITMRHKGAGAKRRDRHVDFLMAKHGVPGIIKTVEYDPNRSAFIGLIAYKDGDRRYMVLPQGVTAGAEIMVAENAPIKPGNRLPLKQIPIGTFIYNIELKPMGGAKMVRSAGSFAEVIAQDNGYTHVKMPSSEIRKVPQTSWASVGAVSNDEHHLVNLGKAGRSRHLGRRPKVRGSAMNPVDHPHGGGEGRQGRGLRRAKTMWGKPSGKGQKTRTPKKYSNYLIVTRRKVGKKRG